MGYVTVRRIWGHFNLCGGRLYDQTEDSFGRPDPSAKRFYLCDEPDHQGCVKGLDATELLEDAED